MSRIKGSALAVGAAMTVLASPSMAHHAFAAEFDANRPLVLSGVVQRMEFTNPHSWIHIEVTLDNGEVQEWAIEGAAPNALLRRGWNRQSLPAGTEIRVRGFQARDRSNRAAGTDVTLPDGSRLFVGSTGIGAAPGTEAELEALGE